MTPAQIKLARHALGLPNKQDTSYRNRYVTAEDDAHWTAMVANGEAKMRPAASLPFGGDAMFWLTTKGATAALKRGEKLCHEDFPQVAA